MMSTCLVHFLLIGFVLALDVHFQEYQDTSFAKQMIPDVEFIIEDYFQQLSTLVTGLYELDMPLPFHSIQDTEGVFLYQTEEPVLHFKRNASFSLVQKNEKWTSRDTIQLRLVSSGDCSELKLETSAPPGLITIEIWEDEIEISIRRMGLKQQPQFLSIPENCYLFVRQIVRSIVLFEPTRTQVQYSYRNNATPWLSDLYSRDLQNLDRFSFITSTNDFPRLNWIKNINSNTAVYELKDTDKIYMIPQDFGFILYDEGEKQRFRYDTVTFIARASIECHISHYHGSGVSIRVLDSETVQVTYLRHILYPLVVENSAAVFLQSEPGCQLQILEISRTIQVQNDESLPQKSGRVRVIKRFFNR